MKVSVVIAARNEERLIGSVVDSAFAAGAAEVIVADGASSDATRSIAAARGARVIECEALRARQLNLGAAVATGEVLLFLHGDTMLPAGACDAIRDAISRGYLFGGFRIRFAEDLFRLRYVAFMVNLRTRITRQPWGDQGQFVARSAFDRYREMPLMEDYEFARRMKRRVMLPLFVTTSGRRFLERGVVRTSVINWLIIVAWHLGVSAERLVRLYRLRK